MSWRRPPLVRRASHRVRSLHSEDSSLGVTRHPKEKGPLSTAPACVCACEQEAAGASAGSAPSQCQALLGDCTIRVRACTARGGWQLWLCWSHPGNPFPSKTMGGASLEPFAKI